MSKKQLHRKFMYACLAVSLLGIPSCNSAVSAAGSPIDAGAQKAAEQYASKVLAKCGDSYYGRTSQLVEMKNLKIVAKPEDPEIAADHRAMRVSGRGSTGMAPYTSSAPRAASTAMESGDRGPSGRTAIVRTAACSSSTKKASGSMKRGSH